jgi:hypothetical protein
MSNEYKDWLNDINYVCSDCARKIGWRWPEGHCATAHYSNCDVCGEHKSLTCENDWLKGKEQTLRSWD